ncbi:Fic family protein [Rhizobium sp. P28RR-XV]|uniref:Fic family protein n=1 Tax=Rhizobium sp. P28RR-XV TaxID=2726737 RepID=UPI0014571744|nr:Fic family protein [Rhizobium sp. P28RR-XV]NLR88569.1 Fic family protein [Rhizobium sp. P28RR-XV]
MEEVPTRIEPAFFEGSIPSSLSDLVVEIQMAAANLGSGLHNDAASELADLVRVMNCYYSNLIEGHNTRPKDIERALAGAEVEEATRPLALEAKAHVIVQREIDHLSHSAALPEPTSIEFISWVHRRFYEEMPNEFRFVERPDGSKVEIVPGQFRATDKDDVAVGRHYPPSSQVVSAFMKYFSYRYKMAQASATSRIISIAAAHHRLNFIHPFTDGNGRVSRLMSHAMAQNAGVGGKGLWSISRGLARGLNEKTEYKRMMDYADSQRMGERDGRGNLSAKALQDYCEWFLSVALDQINFSKAVFAFETLEARYRKLVESVTDDKWAPDVISAVLRHGSLNRGDVNLITKTTDRTARKTTKELVDAGFLKSSSPKTPVRIAFPLDYRERLFPNLFADGDVAAPKPITPTFLTQMKRDVIVLSVPTDVEDITEEVERRIELIPKLQKSEGVEKILGDSAANELAQYGKAKANWKTVQERVINESIGQHGRSRAEVIKTLHDHSPGAITEEQKADVARRVEEAAPGLVARYNASRNQRKPKR